MKSREIRCNNPLLLILFIFLSGSVIAQNGTYVYQGFEPGTYLGDWLILGPFDAGAGEKEPKEELQKTAFDIDQLDPLKLSPKKDQKVKIDGNTYKWFLMENEGNSVGLDEELGELPFHFVYAYAEVEMPADVETIIGLGSDDAVKCWLNGELVHENWIGRPLVKDEDMIRLKMKKGNNTILLKVQNMEYGWGYIFGRMDEEDLSHRLIHLARMGSLDAIKEMAELGVNLNFKTGPGVTAYHAAQVKGRTKAMNLLKELGADDQIPMPPADELLEFLIEQEFEDDAPGISYMVSRDGEILYSGCEGMADLSHKVQVSKDTKFRIGSVTKQFAAAAILKLEELGKLSVNDPVSKYYDGFPKGDSVTIYHFLTHTSGLENFTDRPMFIRYAPMYISTADMVDSIKTFEYIFEPGTSWSYCNSGYFMLGALVEKLSEGTFNDFLQEHFFAPLGMTKSAVHDPYTLIEDEALGYSYMDGEWQNAINWNMSQAGAAGNIYSTVEDLQLWNQALYGGKILNESSMQKMFSPALLNDGNPADAFGQQYGFGVMLNEFRGQEEIWHSGGLHGFVSYLVHYPALNADIAVLHNAMPSIFTSPNELGHEIAEIYFWDQLEEQESYLVNTDLEVSNLEDYTGRYEYPMGAIMEVTTDNGKLFAQLTGQSKLEIFPKEKDVFFWKEVSAEIEFVRDDKGDVVSAIHRQGGAELEVNRAPEVEAITIDPAILKDYEGNYKLAGLDFSIILRDGSLYAQLQGQEAYEVYPKAEDVFFYKVVNAELHFKRDAEGMVTSIDLLQGGIRQEARRVNQ